MSPSKSAAYLSLDCLLILGACASNSASRRSPGQDDPVIGCRGSYWHVMARRLRLHSDLHIMPDQEFFWVAYETAYQRFADARAFPNEVGREHVHNRDADGNLSCLRRELRKARDGLYASLDSSRWIYVVAKACRLSHP